MTNTANNNLDKKCLVPVFLKKFKIKNLLTKDITIFNINSN